MLEYTQLDSATSTGSTPVSVKQSTQCNTQTPELLMGNSSYAQDPLPGSSYNHKICLAQVPHPPIQNCRSTYLGSKC